MRNFIIVIVCFLTVVTFEAQNKAVQIQIDVNNAKDTMVPVWAWFGYDEPNYTYMKDGKKLLAEIADFSNVPVYVRAHSLMCTGDGTAALKWGSTNMYTEDDKGHPIYQWNIVDSIFDTYVNLGMKPLAQIGFMPEALSSKPQPYQHKWEPGIRYSDIFTGWAYPPRDYEKWAELIYQWVKHCVDRYGKEEVESWYWELWNEPDFGYLQAENRLKTYCKMYDYASEAVKRALPTAKMGGPHTTGGGFKFLDGFINHCIEGDNLVTGKTGAPLDFVAFHAKGWPQVVDGRVLMGMKNQLRDVDNNFKVIASHTELKNLPVIIGESDPEGCAACGMHTDPQNAYRNGTMYSSYTAASITRIIDLADHHGVNLIGAVNWSFEFEDQNWFWGFRDLATNGVDKPVLNVFRMFAMMSGNRLSISGDLAYNYESIRDSSVRGELTDMNAFATANDDEVGVMLWNYHDLDIMDQGRSVEVSLANIPAKKITLYHYRIDDKHSNSYEVWKEMGSPQNPTMEQIAILTEAGQLKELAAPQKMKVKNNHVKIEIELPRQAVSLIRLVYQ